ncbi:MAG TPA: thiamine pyrophosphate-binding protein, partial [Armatimonadota bacterium]
MKVTDYIVAFLEAQHIPYVFELSGGMITHLLDSFARRGTIPLISMHHEQAAAFAAEAVARITGLPGVALATSGPGATNLLTGIGSCYFDSVPAVFITGQVNRDEQKGQRHIRQLGFQETDIVAMATPVTKAAWQVSLPDDIPAALTQAFTLACSGRPGPVLLDIPMDVQRAEITAPSPVPVSVPDRMMLDSSQVAAVLASLQSAARPLALIGGGIRSAGVAHALREFIHRYELPTVFSLMATDVLATDDPWRVGVIGTYGNRWANIAVADSDLLLVLGSRLDVRQTGALVDAFRGERTIIHVDCDEHEINNRVPGCIPVVASLPHFFATALALPGPASSSDHRAWMASLAELRARYPDTAELRNCTGINPNIFMHQLAAASGQAAVFTTDVGQNQMWAAQSLWPNANQRILTSGGMGSMGFALPAAIGAAFACAPHPVVMIAGDGGMQCNLQELETVAHHRIPLKMVVVNNGCHGMVRQFQQQYFAGRFPATVWGYSTPDFVRIAAAFGIPGLSVSDPAEVENALRWLWQDPS